MVWGVCWHKLFKYGWGHFVQGNPGVWRQVVLFQLSRKTDNWTWLALLISIDIDFINFSNQFPHIFKFKCHRSLFFSDPHHQLMLRQLFTLFIMSLQTSLFPSPDLSMPSVWPKIFALSPMTVYSTMLKQPIKGHLNYNTTVLTFVSFFTIIILWKFYLH